ncbi:hypothetical protein [Methylophilus sp. 14]|uniref:hypothetical protein n=1 Tax=Methylophilus sp. 14 TaxID=2781019 RepID=UPI001890ADD5|nr:hypothetical protein [Methylophilus sp. 14]MBF4987597.1 hypothetical protein [Methylophilus sp. 14]
MSAFFFKSIPDYYLNKFVAVRDIFDNLYNILIIAEIINHFNDKKTDTYDPEYNFVIYSGDYRRVVVRRDSGYFSMSVPFQIVDDGYRIFFNSDSIKQEVDGYLISIFRNAISTCQEADFSIEAILVSLMDSFGLEDYEATKYLDAFIALINEDHGYFRYDDDEENHNGDIHPRYHLDIFIKNTSTVKIGTELQQNLDCFYSLCDKKIPKKYLRV